MTQPDTHKLAERIAKLLESESQTNDLAALFASIEKINHRLEKLEKSVASQQAEVKTFQPTHPSQDKFAIAEAIADEIFSNYQKEKACTFEPNGKPCDHCGMCSARGF
jgi:uncharacterized protein involved in exopolysaccharide biosynthesis